MRRYAGEELAPGSRIAVVANDAIGNYVVSTPLLQMLRSRWKPSAIHYYSGSRTQELWMEDSNIDWGFPLYGSEPNFSVLNAFAEIGQERYDLVINLEWTTWAKSFTAVISSLNTYVCGPCLGSDGRSDLPFPDDMQGKLWTDQEWISASLPLHYPILESGFIGEIFARLAYLLGAVPEYSVPRQDVNGEIPDVIISAAASLPEKLWPIENWLDLLQRCKSAGRSVGLVGAKPTAQSILWKGASDEEQLV